MEKYRRWTDQATGVNPFIIANQKSHNLIYNIFTILKSLLVLPIFMVLFPFIIISTILPFLSFFRIVLLYVCANVFSFDDNKFSNDLQKLTKKKTKVILSNFISISDVFYFMFKIPHVNFLIIHQNNKGDEGYQLISSLKCIILLLSKSQPFYVNHKQQNIVGFQQSLKTLIYSNANTPTVAFYQGIRTNGLGTIKIPNKFAQQINLTQTDYMICRLSYTPRDQIFHNLVRSSFLSFFRSLGSYNVRKLKIRSQITDFNNIHCALDVKKDVDQFMSNNGSKLLETNPQNYSQFLQFYQKTQRNNYVQQQSKK